MSSNRTRQAGTTLIESLIALTLTVFLVAVVTDLVISSGNATKYAERMSRSTEVSQSILNEMRTELLSTVDLAEAGTTGGGYLAALEFDPVSPILGSSQLATMISTGTFQREATAGAQTGNVLLFARQAWTTEFTCTSGSTYLVDVYRQVCYYLTDEDDGPTPGSPLGLNLCKFVSEPLVDGDQLDRVTDATDHMEMCIHLATATPDDAGKTHPKAALVWRRGRLIANLDTLREINTSTGLLSSTPLSPRPSGSWQIQRDPRRSNSGMLHYRHFSVASNYAAGRFGVGRFGVIDNSGGGFPHGFEVQIAGTSAARQVLLHLSVVTTNRRGTKAQSDLRTTVFVQDV